MEFGWINLFGGIFVILMLVPNIVYAIKNKDEKNLCTNKPMNIIEQIGRYTCIVLMWFPLLVWKFGFATSTEFVIYMISNTLLLVTYWILFAIYMKKKNMGLAISLAIMPSCIFLFSGILLRHWLLVGFAYLFATGHIFVTYINAKQRRINQK